jgi:translation initiation factor IF-3
MKFHANVGDHDYRTKVHHTREFLEKGFKVKLSLTFRGRENAHRELGFEVINRVLKDCEDVSVVEMAPRMMGHSIVVMLGAAGKRPAHPVPAAARTEKTEVKKLDAPAALG